MFVVDVLLVCNLVLLAVGIARRPRPGRSSLDDLLRRARWGEPPEAEQPMGEIVPFPTGDELARRRARSAHPSGRCPHPSTGLV